MTAFIHEVENLYSDYKRSKTVLDEIKAEIRKKISDNYFKWENQLRQSVLFTLSLYWGRYVKSEYDIPNNCSISVGQRYSYETRSFENQNYYNIYRKRGNDIFGQSMSSKYIGFVCSLQELLNKFDDDELKKIWRYYLDDNRKYTGSLPDFKEKFSNPSEFYQVFTDYINYDGLGEVYLLNYPSLKVKNMVLFIND